MSVGTRWSGPHKLYLKFRLSFCKLLRQCSFGCKNIEGGGGGGGGLGE